MINCTGADKQFCTSGADLLTVSVVAGPSRGNSIITPAQSCTVLRNFVCEFNVPIGKKYAG